MDVRVETPAPRQRNTARASQACHRCKNKKIRCDGKIPTCSSCARLDMRCDFPPAQKRRGPGKGKEYIKNLEERLVNMETAFQRAGLPLSDTPESSSRASNQASMPAEPNDGIQLPPHRTGPEAISMTSDRPVGHENSTATVPPVRIMGAHHGNFLQGVIGRMNDLRRDTRYDNLQQQVFAPLFSSDPNQRFIGPVFDEITAPFPYMEWSTLKTRVDDPKLHSDPGWRACVNAHLAMTACFRAAKSAFHEFQGVAWAYFKTAFAILPELTVNGDGLCAIEAVISMAMFVRGSPDVQTLTILISTAGRLYQMMSLHRRARLIVPGSPEDSRHARVFWALYALDQELSIKHGLPPVLDKNGATVPELPAYDAAVAPAAKAFRKRAKLACCETKIYERLYSARSSSKGRQFIMNNIQCLDSGFLLMRWRLEPGVRIELDPTTSAFDDLDTPTTIHVIGMHLAHYHCVQMIHWPSRHVEDFESSEWNPARSQKNCAKAAQDALCLFRHLNSLPFSSIWTFLGYFVAAHIMLLSFMLDNPTDLENTSRVLAMETFVKSLQDITEENGFDLKQIIASCAEMLAIAQSTTETSAASSSSRRHESIREIINGATHPMYLMQNFMGNLKNTDYDLAVALAKELNISWGPEQRYGPFVPESLMPETYAFGFEAGIDPSVRRNH